MKQALIVFAKVPEPGKVKTRLSPPLTPEHAASLYESFLLDALESYTNIQADVRVFLGADSTSRIRYPELAGAHIQNGDDLGERMRNAFENVFSQGYDTVCIIGTDHPTLPIDHIQDAFIAARGNDIAIGPSSDGGYYLLGMNKPSPKLFEDMTYSHGGVFDDTMQRAIEAGLTTYILPEWYDVDDAESLARLAEDLKDSKETLSRTRQSVRQLLELYPHVFDL